MNSRLLKRALSQYGITETMNNPEVMKYYHDTRREWVNSTQTPRCDAFIDWCCMMEGFMFTEGLYAREWLKTDLWNGKVVYKIEEADLVLFWRKDPSSWEGHIAIPIREDREIIWALGGNQHNMVCIADYPLHRKLAYLRLPDD